MKNIIHLVKNLSRAEVRQIRGFYKNDGTKGEMLKPKLFDLIYKGKVTSDEEAAKLLYKSAPGSSYYQLKQRLKTDVFNVLLSQSSNTASTSGLQHAKLECRRLLTVGDILLARGVSGSGKECLEKANEIAETYNLYPEQIAINLMLSDHIGGRRSIKHFYQYFDRVKESIGSLNALQRARELREMALNPSEFKAEYREKLISNFDKVIQEFEGLHEESEVPLVSSWYHRIMLNHFRAKGNTKEFMATIDALLELCENTPALNNVNNKSGIHFALSVMMLEDGEYAESVTHAEQALGYYKKTTFNQLRIMQPLFLAQFYSTNYDSALQIAEDALAHKLIRANRMLGPMWRYYKANAHFMRGELDKASEMLNDQTFVMRDRSGWLVGYKLLELLILAEEKEYSLYQYKLDTFTKLYQSIKCDSPDRVRIILKLMREYSKHSFNKAATVSENETLIELLREGQDSLTWAPDSFELVRIDSYLLNEIGVLRTH